MSDPITDRERRLGKELAVALGQQASVRLTMTGPTPPTTWELGRAYRAARAEVEEALAEELLEEVAERHPEIVPCELMCEPIGGGFVWHVIDDTWIHGEDALAAGPTPLKAVLALQLTLAEGELP